MKYLGGMIGLIALLLGGVWLMPMPDFERDEVRTLPWHLPDHRKAHYVIKELDDGRLYIQIEHVPLKSITPEMLAWFYKHLPISTVQLRGKTLPLYHIFHPSEHGRVEVVEPASDGSKGMGVGALVQRQEWFGEFQSKGAGRIIEFSSQGMTVKPEKFGLHFGLIQHRFEATKDGSRYILTSEIGSKAPVIGSLVNLFIKYKMMPPAMLQQWVRHQIEEVASLQFFLPHLYRVATSGEHKGHYPLDL